MNTNYAAENALLQICRSVNKKCEKVDRMDVKTLSEILHQEYEQLKLIFPDVSYFKFVHKIGQINGQFKEGD